ncbi:hypothetical protein FVE85_6477 [Porphyridium purpureum]|uniref:SnoaL-like domain-containing protein n=1 Tax=Porphyridium purpureum TaxID=35688 RepID=A0A5J4Z748_PORPP|nr:hypothetical protein FVE85_6477 [Porphyridium purpureum]|eukprot:POR0526..scf295_1
MASRAWASWVLKVIVVMGVVSDVRSRLWRSNVEATPSSRSPVAPVAPTQDSVALLLQDMDRIFTESIIGDLSSEGSHDKNAFLAWLPLAPDAKVSLFGHVGVGLDPIRAFQRDVRARLIEPGVQITRVLTRIKKLAVSGTHFDATLLSLWFSSAGEQTWVPATAVGSVDRDGLLTSYSYLVNVDELRVIFDSMNGYPTAESVARDVMIAFQNRDTALLDRLCADNITYVLHSATTITGKQEFLAFMRNVTLEFAIQEARVWSGATNKAHPKPLRQLGLDMWTWDFFGFEFMDTDKQCYAISSGTFVATLDSANRVHHLDQYVDLPLLAIGMAKCRYIPND